MKKKIKVLELIILFIIIVIVIIILYLANLTINNKPQPSNTTDIKNYSVTKYTTYTNDPTNISIYNPPLREYINYQNSSYDIYIISTDNIITDITEKITINYNEYPIEEENNIINFCNNYDEIENKYRLQCQRYNRRIILSNNFNINAIRTDTVKTKEYNIKLPLTYNTKLNDYLNTLKKNNIQYYEVSNIP